MHYDKEDVYQKAIGMEVDILLNLTTLNPEIFNDKKEHPCPFCGGTTRFRYRKKTKKNISKRFYCNNCGSRDWLGMLIDSTGVEFTEAIDMAGAYLNCQPVERLEAIRREYEIATSYPDWYKFDKEVYDKVKSQAEVKLSPWQRINGLNVLDVLAVDKYALFPLLNEKGKECDFVMIDIDGNWQTTGGNTIIPDGYYSVFGVNAGKRAYICVNPYYAAHASISMQCQVVCCYDLANMFSVAAHFMQPVESVNIDTRTTEGKFAAIGECIKPAVKFEDPMVIVTNIEETKEADSIKLNQLTFDKAKRTVGRHFYKPFQICDKIKERGKNE